MKLKSLFVLTLAGSVAATAVARSEQRHVLQRHRSDVQNRCQECHRPGEVAPMSFMTLRSGSSLGQGHQDRGPHQEDAAVVADPHYRQVLERPVSLAALRWTR